MSAASGGDAGLLENVAERRPRPLGGADAFVQPRHARAARSQEAAPVPRALERHPLRARGQRENLVQRERERPRDPAAHGEPEARRVEARDVEMRERVVQADAA